MNNKKFVGVAAFAAMAMTLAGCGSNTAASDDSKIVTDIKNNVTITFWNTMGGDAGKELQSMTKAFMKKNPKIKVVLQNQSNYSDLQQKVTTTLQSPKNLPTLTQAYSSWLTDGIKDGAVVNLDQFRQREAEIRRLEDRHSSGADAGCAGRRQNIRHPVQQVG